MNDALDDEALVTPSALAHAFTRTGGFDSCRKALIAHFLASPDKELLLERLSEILPPLLSQPSFKSIPRNGRHSTLMKEIETKNTVLQRTVAELEADLRRREKDGERGGVGIGRQLEALLRRSRGVVEDDVVDPVASTSTLSTTTTTATEPPPPSQSSHAHTLLPSPPTNPIENPLPTPPHILERPPRPSPSQSSLSPAPSLFTGEGHAYVASPLGALTLSTGLEPPRESKEGGGEQVAMDVEEGMGMIG